LKRCYLCSEPLNRDDDMVKCEHCNVWCHRACLAEQVDAHCPRCDDEALISVAGF
jgi:hypothetical protein